MTEDRGHLPSEVFASLAGSLVPGSEPLLKRLAENLRAEHARLTSRALQVAERVAGMNREDLGEALARDPALQPLYVRVLWAAGMNGHDETLSAMGALLGMAATASTNADPEGVEDAAAALRALENLGPRDFAVLAALIAQERPLMNHVATARALALPLRLPTTAVEQSLVSLASAGLASLGSGFAGKTPCGVTPLGLAVEKAARAVASEGDR